MKTKFLYKKIAPDIEKIKTDSVLRICAEALKRKQAEEIHVVNYSVLTEGGFTAEKLKITEEKNL